MKIYAAIVVALSLVLCAAITVETSPNAELHGLKTHISIDIPTTTTTVTTTTTTTQPPAQHHNPPATKPAPHPVAPIPDDAAKAYIYRKESGFNPCAYNPGKSDCNYTGEKSCGLGGANPCSKMRDHCSMSDYACQDDWFTNSYMRPRYGTWQKAYAFHVANGWW